VVVVGSSVPVSQKPAALRNSGMACKSDGVLSERGAPWVKKESVPFGGESK